MADEEVYINAAIAAIRDSSIPPAGVANTILAQCTQAVANAPVDDQGTEEGDTPGLESFLWTIWTRLLELAKEDASTHDRLARILAAVQAKGVEGCSGWTVWGSPVSWARLPVFGLVSREEMNGIDPITETGEYLDLAAPAVQAVLSGDTPAPSDSAGMALARARTHWLNTNAFFALLWAQSVYDGAFFAIATMRMQLEPLTLSSTSEPTADMSKRDGNGEPQEVQIEVAATWLRIAGRKMFECREIMGPKGNPDWRENWGRPGGSGGKWEGVDGFHPDRWVHWKGILKEVAKGKWRRNVIEAAQAAVDAMEQVEREAASE